MSQKLFPFDRMKKGMLPLKEFTPGEEEIKLWLSDRVFPPNREGAYKLLHAMGLNSYDMWVYIGCQCYRVCKTISWLS